ncbi:DUF3107 domain-containing protein [Galbitalea sp. SE-J8]|uniref:DUF3107 domain-containing protein n=1 Tax=Galbitalea sp. SE-J8 TaxID=3054952 RepID=UPI00259CC1D1|nr:DUF3107 domain-containing protein [Galbitalea sp. SE-J8]MDM4763512.1 DUF3107 domain-containing protein [Galbitalea sp. SE-J8]
MDISIGIQNSPREISFESAQSSAEVQQAIADALASSSPLVTFTDVKGKVVIVPTAAIAYIELGTEQSRRVGFVA